MTSSGSMNKNVFRAILVALPIIIFVFLTFFERITVGQGLGWDGSGYYSFVHMILDGELSEKIGSYYIQRVSSSALIAGVAFISGNVPSVDNVLHGFIIINIISILFSIFFYFKISSKLKFGPMTELFGFIGIFYSFFVLKMSSYYPMLVDVPAFALGFGLLFAFLYKIRWLSYLILLIGAFTFPTILMFGLILLLLEPARDQSDKRSGFQITMPPNLLVLGKWAVYLFPFVVVIGYILFSLLIFKFKPEYVSTFFEGRQVVLSEVLISGFFTAILLFYFTAEIVKGCLYAVEKVFISYSNLLILVFLYIGIKAAQGMLSNPNLSLDWQWFVINLFKQSIQYPLSSVVSHIMYFGPVLILGLIYFKKVGNELKQHGLGLMLFFFANMIMFILGNESRQFVVFIPFFIIFTLAALKSDVENILNYRLLVFHAFLALLISRCWFIINVKGFDVAAQVLSKTAEFDDPLIQRYFISHGPWMIPQSYFIMLGASVILSVIFLYIYRPAKFTDKKLNFK